MIISFSGIDGAGKSTQIDKLTRYFQHRGERVFSIWARGGYTPGMEWSKRMARQLFGWGLPNSGHSKARTQSLSKPWVANLWLTAAMLDLLVLYGVVVRFRSMIGQVVICDRYLGDTALDLSLNFPQTNFEQMWLWRLLLLFVPKPDCSFMLLLPISVSMERSKLKNEPFPDSEETLVKRLAVYQSSSWFSEYERIDALQGVDDIAAQIQRSLH